MKVKLPTYEELRQQMHAEFKASFGDNLAPSFLEMLDGVAKTIHAEKEKLAAQIEELWDKLATTCGDRGCQREAGHVGMHMSRTWDASMGMEIVDEWGNVDLEALIKEKP